MTPQKDKKNEEKQIAFIPLSEAARLAGYTPEHFNLLSRNGKLKAEKIGRNWYTKKGWVNDFLEATGKEKIEASEEAPEKIVEVEKQSGLQNSKEAVIVFEKNTEYSLCPKNLLGEAKFLAAFQPIEKGSWQKVFAAVFSAVIILPIIVAGSYAVKNFLAQADESFLPQVLLATRGTESQIANENTGSGKVAGEETEKETGIVSSSENFRVRDIALGSGMVVLASENSEELEISNIKSESFIASKNDEVKLVVSWQTNKPAVSEIAVSKNDGQNPEIFKEDSYGFVHSVVAPGLDQGTSYVYQIKCKDHWANEKISDYFGIYTSSKPVSVFDLISNAMGEVFGWAVRK